MSRMQSIHSATDPVEVNVFGQVFTEGDELGGIPEADANGDQTAGMGAL